MQEQMQERQVKQEGFKQQAPTQNSSPAARSQDYIDFEEVK